MFSNVVQLVQLTKTKNSTTSILVGSPCSPFAFALLLLVGVLGLVMLLLSIDWPNTDAANMCRS